MERKIITTADGSTTIHIPEWNEHYHSKHGAIQEAQHVFIEMGLEYWLEKFKTKSISILEIGFGTGLNALITLAEADKKQININYTGVEAYPVSASEIEKLNYCELPAFKNFSEKFSEIHQLPWEKAHQITDRFQLKKVQQKFQEISVINEFDLIYFDAFGIRVQPKLWEEPVFKKMFSALKANGVLVTYAANGQARRAMQSVGFLVEKLPGPPGKREMLRAIKNS